MRRNNLLITLDAQQRLRRTAPGRFFAAFTQVTSPNGGFSSIDIVISTPVMGPICSVSAQAGVVWYCRMSRRVIEKACRGSSAKRPKAEAAQGERPPKGHRAILRGVPQIC